LGVDKAKYDFALTWDKLRAGSTQDCLENWSFILDKHKQSFIQLALACNVLRFGQFELKSGRVSPYFFNAGHFNTGASILELGKFYADIIVGQNIRFQHLFGPAYKGIPLATSTAIALAQRGIETTISFNRKEVKNHGEGGQLIGAPLSGDTIIIDDVITAGTAFRESKDIITKCGGTPTAMLIALDRCERGTGDTSAIDEIKSQGIAVYSVITLFDLIDYLEERGDKEQVEAIRRYHGQYGV